MFFNARMPNAGPIVFVRAGFMYSTNGARFTVDFFFPPDITTLTAEVVVANGGGRVRKTPNAHCRHGGNQIPTYPSNDTADEAL